MPPSSPFFVKFREMVSILFRDILSSFARSRRRREGGKVGNAVAFSKAAQPLSFPPSMAGIHRATILERCAAGSSSRIKVLQ